jgi:hypothetical protein
LITTKSTVDFNDIQAEVAEWAKRNFGEQQSRYNGIILNSMAPLLGMVEENGERYAATDELERNDAVCDTLIYLMDYLAREGVHIDDLPPGNPAVPIACSIGRLCHCTLKRHQGIRGFDDPAKYAEVRDQACADLVSRFCWKFGAPEVREMLLTTWGRVKQRDWIKNKANAAEIAEAQAG